MLVKVQEPGWSVDEAWSPSGQQIALVLLEHLDDGYHFKNALCDATTGATLDLQARSSRCGELHGINFVPVWSALGHRCFLPLTQHLVTLGSGDAFPACLQHEEPDVHQASAAQPSTRSQCAALGQEEPPAQIVSLGAGQHQSDMCQPDHGPDDLASSQPAPPVIATAQSHTGMASPDPEPGQSIQVLQPSAAQEPSRPFENAAGSSITGKLVPDAHLPMQAVCSVPIEDASEAALLSPCGTLLVDIIPVQHVAFHHHIAANAVTFSTSVVTLMGSKHAKSRSSSSRPEVAWLGLAMHGSLLYATCALSTEHVYLVDGSHDQLLRSWGIPGLLSDMIHRSPASLAPTDEASQIDAQRLQIAIQAAGPESSPGSACSWSPEGRSLAVFTQGLPLIILNFAGSQLTKQHVVSLRHIA